MSKFSMPVYLASIGVSFFVGFGVAWKLLDNDAAKQHSAPSLANSSESGRQSGSNQFADVWNKSGSSSLPTHGAPVANPIPSPTIDEQKIREAAQSDPAYLRNLIASYDTERNPANRDMIRSVLTTLQKPEVVTFVSRLAHSNDPAQRKEAFDMLQNMPPNSAEVRNLLKQTLASEQTPAVLSQAVAALKPSVVDPAESEAIVGQLRGLTQHSDPTVRSQSLLQLAQWDKGGTNHDRLMQALSDTAPEVRQAAIFAIAQSGARADGIKSALLNIINNVNESRDVKGSALQVLERFSLSKEELASYNQARSQVGL